MAQELFESQKIEQDGAEMEQLRQATGEFVDLLSSICSKYGIEQDDIAAMNAGLEKVWNSVTMSEELPDAMEELPEAEEEVVDEEA